MGSRFLAGQSAGEARSETYMHMPKALLPGSPVQ